ncbi:MAG TPA: hypothetical protein PLI18_20180 [Pirellulaceae bacterium]|nr:hypothetical protein [Pirellulaceae bacterium]
MRSIATQFERKAKAFRVIAETMEDEKLEVIECTHYDAITKSLDFSHGFELALNRAITGAIEKRGDFKAVAPRRPTKRQS